MDSEGRSTEEASDTSDNLSSSRRIALVILCITAVTIVAAALFLQ